MSKLFFLFCIMLAPPAAQAQIIQPFVINVSGGLLIDNTVNVEWSLGELAITAIGTSDNLLTQGFLQPLLDSVTAVHNLVAGHEMIVYPNPVSTYLFFSPPSAVIATVSVCDVLGRKVLETDFTAMLDVHELAAGLYFITLSDQKQGIISVFKIFKI